MSGWSDLWDVVTGKSQAESDALDAKLAKLNADKYARGEWNRDQYELAESHRAQGRIEALSSTVDAAAQGAQEGLNNIADGISNTIDSTAQTTAGFFFKAIPWWVWLGGLAYVAFRLGLLDGAFGRIKKIAA